MIKFRIYPESYNFLNGDVFVEIQLPALPRVDDYIVLSETDKETILSRLKSNLKEIKNYPLNFFYGLTEKSKSRLSKGTATTRDIDNHVCLDDLNYVTAVLFNSGEDFITLELSQVKGGFIK